MSADDTPEVSAGGWFETRCTASEATVKVVCWP